MYVTFVLLYELAEKQHWKRVEVVYCKSGENKLHATVNCRPAFHEIHMLTICRFSLQYITSDLQEYVRFILVLLNMVAENSAVPTSTPPLKFYIIVFLSYFPYVTLDYLLFFFSTSLYF